MAEIRVVRERRSILPWILGLLLLALVIWGVAGMSNGDDATGDSGPAAVGVTIQQQPPALRQYAQAAIETAFAEAA